MRAETRILIDYVLIAVGFTIAGVSTLGEILGWWNDGGAFGLVLGLGVAVYGAIDVNGFRLLHRFAGQERRMDAMLGNQGAMLGRQDAMLGKQDAMLAKQDETVRLLGRIVQILDERLPRAG